MGVIQQQSHLVWKTTKQVEYNAIKMPENEAKLNFETKALYELSWRRPFFKTWFLFVQNSEE